MESSQPNNKLGLIVIVFLVLIVTGLYIIYKLYSQPHGQSSISPTPSQEMSFPTPTLVPANQLPTPLPPEEAAKAQTQADQNYAQETLKRDETYVWLDKLPLETNQYFVYFDVDTKKIIAKIYDKSGDQQAIKNEITSNLKEIGVELEKYPIEWK